MSQKIVRSDVKVNISVISTKHIPKYQIPESVTLQSTILFGYSLGTCFLYQMQLFEIHEKLGFKNFFL